MRTRRSLKDAWSVRRVQTSCTQLLKYDHNLIPPRERGQFPNKFYRIYMTWVCFLEKGMGRGMERYSTHPHPLLQYAFSTEGSFPGVVLQQRSVLGWGSISQNNAPHKRANINTSPSHPHRRLTARVRWSQGGWWVVGNLSLMPKNLNANLVPCIAPDS